jgi:hypothetical protein
MIIATRGIYEMNMNTFCNHALYFFAALYFVSVFSWFTGYPVTRCFRCGRLRWRWNLFSTGYFRSWRCWDKNECNDLYEERMEKGFLSTLSPEEVALFESIQSDPVRLAFYETVKTVYEKQKIDRSPKKLDKRKDTCYN